MERSLRYNVKQNNILQNFWSIKGIQFNSIQFNSIRLLVASLFQAKST